ncbi:sensor histidine kinase [Agromyces rhizosphaerae]|nr:GAF domain-containing sensor histidine kinase [Agromyces rhizosphaerae]
MTQPRSVLRRGASPATVAAVAVWLLVVAAWLATWVVFALAGADSLLVGQFALADAAGSLFALTMASVGALVVVRGGPTGYGALMLAFGATSIVVNAAGYYALLAVPDGLPLAAAAVWLQDLFPIGFLLGVLLLPSLFPDGTAASPGWRRAVATVAAGWIAYIAFFAFVARPAENLMFALDEPPSNPLGVIVLPAEVLEFTVGLPWLVLVAATVVVSFGSLVTRWRRARSRETRQQLAWVVFAFALVLLALLASEVLNSLAFNVFGVDLGLAPALDVVGSIALVGLAVAWGIAVLRFRLHSIDLVINRTVVYGTLTLTITAVYVVLVVGVGSLLPVEQPTLALGATVLVAVGVAPLRDALQRVVNRVMFGRRDDPYAVMSELGRLLSEAGTPEETLQTLVDTVGESLKLPGVAVELEQDGAWVVQAAHGTPPPPGTGASVPLRDRGELVGRLIAAPRSPREPLSEGDLALLADIAGPAASVARTVRLTADLRASRERLVLAREEERRRIRRDLHDGLGPSLAAQTFQLDEILDRVGSDPEGAAEVAAALKERNRELVADVRRLVHALRPPTLDELGLAGALRAHASQLDGSGRMAVRIASVPDPLPPVPAAVEVAGYHIAREAVTNAIRHARATRCTVTLAIDGPALVVAVRDDGRGMAEGDGTGLGMRTMRERAEELGGRFAVHAGNGPAGVEVVATIPLREAAVAEQASSEAAS